MLDIICQDMLHMPHAFWSPLSHRASELQWQEVMREWDLDGSGMVGVEELTAAAGAYKKACLLATWVI